MLARLDAFGSCDEKLAVDSLRWSEFPTDADLFFEPFHCFGTLECPYQMDLFGHGLTVSHLLDEVEELGDDCCNTAATREQDHSVEGSQVSPHATIRSVDKSLIDMFRPFLDS